MAMLLEQQKRLERAEVGLAGESRDAISSGVSRESPFRS